MPTLNVEHFERGVSDIGFVIAPKALHETVSGLALALDFGQTLIWNPTLGRYSIARRALLTNCLRRLEQIALIRQRS